MNENINKDLTDKVNKSIDDILNYPVEKISFDSSVPVNEDIPDSNKVFKGEVSILFADMRNSTGFTDDNSAITVVKVYRSFIKTITRAVRACHGNVRDFLGDGVLAVFSEKEIDGEVVSSAKQAVLAGRMICTLIDYCLNPKLKKKVSTIIGYGIGICTGTVLATKVGMRGNESNPDVENETGVIWIGACTNYASKYCGVATSGEIVIDRESFIKQSDKDLWIPMLKFKGDKVYDCFVSSNNYLDIDSNSEPIRIKTDLIHNSAGEQISRVISEKLYEFESKVGELSLLSDHLNQKEKELQKKESHLEKEEESLNKYNEVLKEQKKLIDEIHFEHTKSIITNAFLKAPYIIECGEDFWDDALDNAIETGKAIGKTKHDVEIDLCYYLVNIYETLNSWEKAYDYLCIQAQYNSWINANSFEKIIVNSKHWSRIKCIIDTRIYEEVSSPLESVFKKCQEILHRLGYDD